MCDAFEKCVGYGFNDELEGLMDLSIEGAKEDLAKTTDKAEIAKAIADNKEK